MKGIISKKVVAATAGIAYLLSLASFTTASAPKTAVVNKVLTTTGVVNSQAYNFNNVKITGTGYIPSVIFNPTEKDLVYARTDMGGAYRWDKTTSTWKPLTDWAGFDDWDFLGCESIATDPIETNRLYIAAGTYTNSWSPNNGYILRSTDKGNTFQKTQLPFKFGGNMPGRNAGERLVIDPNDDKILYLGARSGNGLWRSTDYGVTWSQVTSFPDPGNYVKDPSLPYTADKLGILWEVFQPTTEAKGTPTQTIYVGVADNDTTSNNIYCSTDGGKTWKALAGQPHGIPASADGSVKATGFLPHHGVLSSNGNLYITYSNTDGPYDGSLGAVWKYDTKAKTWTDISPVPAIKDGKVNADEYYGYGGLAVDAQHPDTIMVTTLNSWWPDANIFRSTDGGKSWSSIWSWNGYPDRTLRYTQDISASPWLTFGAKPSTDVSNGIAPKLGWMIGDIKIDPFNSDHMLYGTGATLYGSDNLTDWDKGTKITISVKAQGIEESAVLSLAVLPSGTLMSGIGDVNGFKHDDITKSPTDMIPFGASTTSLDYAELKPSFLVRVVNPDTNHPNQKCSSYTYDGGSNWFNGNVDIPGMTGGGTVAAAADASLVLWAPDGGAVSYSKDNGNSWKASTGIPQGVKVASDRVNPKKFYGFGNGKFYVSVDAGVSFTESAATGLPSSANIKAVPGIEGDIWLAGEDDTVKGMWHSTDSGATFTKLSNVDASDTVGFGKAAPGKTYMAVYTSAKVNGVRGIFRSDDAGKSWIRINDDQHQYGCTNACITGDPTRYGRVYIGTNGRGIIYGDISPAPVLIGDLNGDKLIDTNDYTLLKKYLIRSIKSFTVSNGSTAADVNGDGKINVLDYLMMKNYINKKITKFPAQK
ncbi:MAG: dockerin type I domain-containing protein [Bacillota bacterium]|nr:dockerin type I domain-containing protein [Bacillota bacterium]